ncbi:DUF2948 family protein [Mangrovicoccus algicola]|uniref:DUF2948 family protein n=1 Tax=Mangrovicoccus algicola TaxID=2771008 RepID=A0A8J6YVU6_9RHOB|nr:DUF2948 family protein [Mangrovicoccus algicola]MBE3636711.1 DUF2948 family protein [Mangrovicoccus algicola]
MSDARFEDGAEQPLRLIAADADDLQVISALVQDAVLPAAEMTWEPKARRFSLLLNRFRWEDRAAAERAGRPVERVQSVLSLGDVRRVSSQGLDRRDPELILSLLGIGFEPGEDGQGAVILSFAGDGALRLEVECLDATLSDVTRPYVAPSGRVPHHPD